MGITEVSDAVVLVISEETGKVNLCHNGQFFYMKNEEVLRKHLRQLLVTEKSEGLDEFSDARRSA